MEERLNRIEQILSLLQSGNVGLDEALALFEEGVAHVGAAEEALTKAELRIEEVLARGRSRPLATPVEGMSGKPSPEDGA